MLSFCWLLMTSIQYLFGECWCLRISQPVHRDIIHFVKSPSSDHHRASLTGMMWLMVCSCPQLHSSDAASPHLYKFAWHGPWPTQNRFNSSHNRGRSKLGCRIVGSHMRWWLTTEADNCVLMLEGDASAQIWWLDASHCSGWLVTSIQSSLLTVCKLQMFYYYFHFVYPQQ